MKEHVISSKSFFMFSQLAIAQQKGSSTTDVKCKAIKKIAL
jgi:hypothetical protein